MTELLWRRPKNPPAPATLHRLLPESSLVLHYNSVYNIAVYSLYACLQKYRQRKISDQISPPIYRGCRYSIYRPIYSPCRYIGRPLLESQESMLFDGHISANEDDTCGQ